MIVLANIKKRFCSCLSRICLLSLISIQHIKFLFMNNNCLTAFTLIGAALPWKKNPTFFKQNKTRKASNFFSRLGLLSSVVNFNVGSITKVESKQVNVVSIPENCFKLWTWIQYINHPQMYKSNAYFLRYKSSYTISI